MLLMLQPCHILLAALIGQTNERQRRIIKFQNDQIEALLKAHGIAPAPDRQRSQSYEHISQSSLH